MENKWTPGGRMCAAQQDTELDSVEDTEAEELSALLEAVYSAKGREELTARLAELAHANVIAYNVLYALSSQGPVVEFKEFTEYCILFAEESEHNRIREKRWSRGFLAECVERVLDALEGTELIRYEDGFFVNGGQALILLEDILVKYALRDFLDFNEGMLCRSFGEDAFPLVPFPGSCSNENGEMNTE